MTAEVFVDPFEAAEMEVQKERDAILAKKAEAEAGIFSLFKQGFHAKTVSYFELYFRWLFKVFFSSCLALADKAVKILVVYGCLVVTFHCCLVRT